MRILLFISLVLSFTTGCKLLVDKYKINLNINETSNFLINPLNPLNLTIVSKNNIGFNADIYTIEGKIKKFKSSKIEYIGYPTLIELLNIDKDINNIKIYLNIIESDKSNISF